MTRLIVTTLCSAVARSLSTPPSPPVIRDFWISAPFPMCWYTGTSDLRSAAPPVMHATHAHVGGVVPRRRRPLAPASEEEDAVIVPEEDELVRRLLVQLLPLLLSLAACSRGRGRRRGGRRRRRPREPRRRRGAGGVHSAGRCHPPGDWLLARPEPGLSLA